MARPATLSITEEVMRDLEPGFDWRNANRSEKWPWVCPVHGVYYQRVYHHIEGRRCKKCSISKNNLGRAKSIPEWALREVSPDFDMNSAGRNANTDHWVWVCPEHGKYEQTYAEHVYQNHGCPICSRKRALDKSLKNWREKGQRSQVELDIEAYVKSLGVFVTHEPTIIREVREIDIYMPDLKKGIEVDGYGHYECLTEEEYVSRKRSNLPAKPPGYHETKTRDALEMGIKLVHITDKEWRESRGKTEDKIRRFIYGEVN